MGQKTSDFSAVPLCSSHHRTNQDSYHRLGEAQFEQVHQIDLRELVIELNELYFGQAEVCTDLTAGIGTSTAIGAGII
jgi:hypothetical protein